MLKSHIFRLNNKIRKQTKGGAIGVEDNAQILTGSQNTRKSSNSHKIMTGYLKCIRTLFETWNTIVFEKVLCNVNRFGHFKAFSGES